MTDSLSAPLKAPAPPSGFGARDYECSVAFGAMTLHLMPDGSVFDPASRTLLVADVHVGKAEVFRRLAVPVPSATSKATFARLDRAIARCRPQRLIVLGDLVHGRLPDAHPVHDDLAHWRHTHCDIAVELVLGNHDRGAGLLPPRCAVHCYIGNGQLGDAQLCHEPDEAPVDALAICGHVHPVVRLNGSADSLRLRCFWLSIHRLVLPAFGAFTGGHTIKSEFSDRLFVIDGERVYPVPPTRSRGGVRRGKRTDVGR